uniref:Uncharacterized protein n=1 Tax=Lepeophtheirus salmonis TaxID=72036 RepID=A0A0K2UHW1_LEPSM|nr:uncharacterized protein LOC121130370 [Lepeophtheirus salmonis]
MKIIVFFFINICLFNIIQARELPDDWDTNFTDLRIECIAKIRSNHRYYSELHLPKLIPALKRIHYLKCLRHNLITNEKEEEESFLLENHLEDRFAFKYGNLSEYPMNKKNNNFVSIEKMSEETLEKSRIYIISIYSIITSLAMTISVIIVAVMKYSRKEYCSKHMASPNIYSSTASLV